MRRPACHRFVCRVVAALLIFLAAAADGGAAEREHSGGWRLAQESSPYLRMHADNPVEWFPWDEEAFAKARRENKPLFISIGYFTCHWCHVMARESFSNPEIAALLNAHFVAVKVDREQRPDVDAAYMNYVIATRGQGGWPLSVWATPDGYPFFGGSYFPPDNEQGRTGMIQILTRLSGLWATDEKRLRAAGEQAVTVLRRQESTPASSVKPSATLPVDARLRMAADYDELQGGFGPTPRFPQPARLFFLLQDDDAASAAMAMNTLDHMAAGGIHDQLAGGFHRYATDFDWRVPHFEKMLYDQALIARAYLLAWLRSGYRQYARVARTTLDFTLAQLRDPGGGFWSALSADSLTNPGPSGYMEEGAYYTWDWPQLTAALGEGDLRRWAAAHYGLSEPGNARGNPSGELAGRNVLYLAMDSTALARTFGVDLETAERRNAEVTRRLLEARRQRPAVPVDDKIVTVWNGFMIETLALAGRLLEEPRYTAAAAVAAGFILDQLYDDGTGVLYRDWRQGVRGVPGFCEDYAALTAGLLGLYEANGAPRWLASARRLADRMLERYQDADHGGFYRSAASSGVWLREKQVSDGASLSVNGVAIQALLALGRVTGDRRYADAARRAALWAATQLADAPEAMPSILVNWGELSVPARR
ncbi:MAG: thioredoxin domain-containing protein [Gammaproteobacteria bacterium]